MRRYILRAVIVLVLGLALLIKYCALSAEQTPKQTQQQTEEQFEETKTEKDEKGKMEQFGEVPPAPGDEEETSQKQEQKEKPVQKQTQKQAQDI